MSKNKNWKACARAPLNLIFSILKIISRAKNYFPTPENKFRDLSNHQTHSRSHFSRKPWQLQDYNRNVRLKAIFLPLKISFGASPTTKPTPGVIFRENPWQLQDYNRNVRLKAIFLPLKISFGTSPTTKPTPGVIFRENPWQLQDYNRDVRLKAIFLPLKISFGTSPTTKPTPGRFLCFQDTSMWRVDCLSSDPTPKPCA